MNTYFWSFQITGTQNSTYEMLVRFLQAQYDKGFSSMSEAWEWAGKYLLFKASQLNGEIDASGGDITLTIGDVSVDCILKCRYMVEGTK